MRRGQPGDDLPPPPPPPRVPRQGSRAASRTARGGEGRGEAQRLVFFHNVGFDLEEGDLKPIFERAGKVVSLRFHRDEEGKSKGHGLCEFSSPEIAERAVEMLQGTELPGRNPRTLRVKLHTGSAGAGGLPAWAQRIVLFMNVDYAVDRRELEAFFGRVGKVRRLKLKLGPDKRFVGKGTCEFETREGAERAMRELDECQINGVHTRQVAVRPYDLQAQELMGTTGPSVAQHRRGGQGGRSTWDSDQESSAGASRDGEEGHWSPSQAEHASNDEMRSPRSAASQGAVEEGEGREHLEDCEKGEGGDEEAEGRTEADYEGDGQEASDADAGSRCSRSRSRGWSSRRGTGSRCDWARSPAGRGRSWHASRGRSGWSDRGGSQRPLHERSEHRSQERTPWHRGAGLRSLSPEAGLDRPPEGLVPRPPSMPPPHSRLAQRDAPGKGPGVGAAASDVVVGAPPAAAIARSCVLEDPAAPREVAPARAEAPTAAGRATLSDGAAAAAARKAATSGAATAAVPPTPKKLPVSRGPPALGSASQAAVAPPGEGRPSVPPPPLPPLSRSGAPPREASCASRLGARGGDAAGGARSEPVGVGAVADARSRVDLACGEDGAVPRVWQTVPEIVNVRLTLNGKAKLVRHAANTKISELLAQRQAATGEVLVAKDSRGYEMGGEVSLGQLIAQPGASGVLELFLEPDVW